MRPSRSDWQRILRHWPVVPALLVGGWLRFHGFPPSFLYGDEAEYATVARSLAHDPRDLAYPEIEGLGPTPFVSQPPLVLYLFALGIRLTGRLEAGPALVSVLLGLATLVVVYALGVLLQGRTAGAAAATILAVLPAHVRVSRAALLDAGFTFFFAACMLAFLVWSHRRTTFWAAATGVLAGATVLSKLPGILVFVPLGTGLGWEWLQSRREARHAGVGPDRVAFRKELGWAAAPVAVLGAAYVFLLMYLGATQDLLLKLGWQAGRVAGAADSGNIHRHWQWYFTDSSGGLATTVGIPLAVLALLGATAMAIWILRRPEAGAGAVALLTWPVWVLAFFLASDRKEWFYLLPLLPGVALLGGVAVQTLQARLPPLRGPRSRHLVPKAAAITLVALVLVLATATAVPVRKSMEEASGRARFGAGVREAALWIHERDPDAIQVGTLLGRWTLYLYNGQPTYHYYLNHSFVESQILAGRVRYVVLDNYLDATYEAEWMRSLVAAHNGTLAASFAQTSNGFRVQVFALEAAPSMSSS